MSVHGGHGTRTGRRQRQEEGKEEEEEDPVDRMIAKTGCGHLHHALQDCMAQHQDWRQCQSLVQDFKRCMEGQRRERGPPGASAP
ncbi:cytochrome c oxidase assembly factor 4 homolog, mitochondrial [Leucoraja erinacea]|uniref:cytochrome c oxidase assembly factor 4 homolog, mitochondrial n=1 Tax=Leucoraja erinaceus TaxID=7782 RepID=UPI002454B3E3|nr:cytochrome c oxidase assembly factor 4 homolog, mitochondrial [Leucoraja erinacea]